MRFKRESTGKTEYVSGTDADGNETKTATRYNAGGNVTNIRKQKKMTLL